MAALRYWLWFTTRPSLKAGEAMAVLEHFGGDPERAYFADPEEYGQISGLSKEAKAALEDKSTAEAERILADCDRCDIRPLTWQDSDYPERLRNIADPPLVLYIKGRWPRHGGYPRLHALWGPNGGTAGLSDRPAGRPGGHRRGEGL